MVADPPPARENMALTCCFPSAGRRGCPPAPSGAVWLAPANTGQRRLSALNTR